MAAITTLSTLSASRFGGGRRLTTAKTDGLAASLNTIIVKINAVISRWNAGTLDTLDVGTGTGTYYGSTNSWLEVTS